MTKKMRYNISLLGVTDYYGHGCIPSRFLDWLNMSCKGDWQYNSPNAPLGCAVVGTHKPSNTPVFFDMIFSFARKSDYERFLRKFT